MCNMLFEVNCSCDWTQKEVCFSVRVTELRSLCVFVRVRPLTLSTRYVILQREVWTVRHAFTMSYQSFSHDFKTVDHHHPCLAHSQAVHVPIRLCQLGTDATGEEHNNISGNQNRCIISRSTSVRHSWLLLRSRENMLPIIGIAVGPGGKLPDLRFLK